MQGRPGQRAGEPHQAAVTGQRARRHRDRRQQHRTGHQPVGACPCDAAGTAPVACPTTRGGSPPRARPRPPRPSTDGDRVGLPDQRDERAAQREQRRDAAPSRDPVARARPGAGEPARVHRLGERHRPLQPELEHGHDLAQEPSPAHHPAAGPGAVGLADVVDGRERRRHERQPDHDDQPDLVERTGRRLHQLGVRDHRVERAEHAHHADDGEPLGEGLEHDPELDGAADGEATEQLREPEVGRREEDVAHAVGRRHGEQHAYDGEQRAHRQQQRERTRVRTRLGVQRHRDGRDPDDQRDVHRVRRELDARGRRQRPHEPHTRVPGRTRAGGGDADLCGGPGGRCRGIAWWSSRRTNVPSRQRLRATRMLRAVPGLRPGDGGSRCETDADPQL